MCADQRLTRLSSRHDIILTLQCIFQTAQYLLSLRTSSAQTAPVQDLEGMVGLKVLELDECVRPLVLDGHAELLHRRHVLLPTQPGLFIPGDFFEAIGKPSLFGMFQSMPLSLLLLPLANLDKSNYQARSGAAPLDYAMPRFPDTFLSRCLGEFSDKLSLRTMTYYFPAACPSEYLSTQQSATEGKGAGRVWIPGRIRCLGVPRCPCPHPAGWAGCAAGGSPPRPHTTRSCLHYRIPSSLFTNCSGCQGTSQEQKSYPQSRNDPLLGARILRLLQRSDKDLGCLHPHGGFRKIAWKR